MPSIPTTIAGFYRLNWIQRIGFASGDLAQNLIYQTVGMYLLLFYTNVYGLHPVSVSLMFGIVRIIDVIGTPSWAPTSIRTILDGVNTGRTCFWVVYPSQALPSYAFGTAFQAHCSTLMLPM